MCGNRSMSRRDGPSTAADVSRQGRPSPRDADPGLGGSVLRSARCAAAPAAAAGGEVSGGVDFMESYDLDDAAPGEGAVRDDYALDDPQL